jgi:hypothetical protein
MHISLLRHTLLLLIFHFSLGLLSLGEESFLA